MTNVLEARVVLRKNGNEEYWEGTVMLDGSQPTKIVRKSDNSTRFTSKTACSGAVRRFADRYGYNSVNFAETPVKAVLKKAAKKSVVPSPLFDTGSSLS